MENSQQNSNLQPVNNFVIFSTEEGKVNIDVYFKDDTLWLTQKKIAALFQKGRSTITEHLKNLFSTQELQENLVCRNFRHTANDGKTAVRLYTKDGNVWMNQSQLAVLFDTSKQNIGQHTSNILEEKELEENSVVKNYFTTGILYSKKLIEGRKPNFYIASKVASVVDEKGEYIKMRGIDNDYIQKIITDYLTKFESAKRSDLENVLLNKLSEGLDISQKINKIKNSIQALKKQGVIVVEGKLWKMSK
ncbi:hypothetical protein [Polaribacter sp. 11A2H]|uniref:hypothetical protein n=1 Tax=Polaribacter sp. 11A2H TaxID=2687290 RepID=UPI00197B6F82|nr:hypothetical protein [Polaribacter sp. 11A2H]